MLFVYRMFCCKHFTFGCVFYLVFLAENGFRQIKYIESYIDKYQAYMYKYRCIKIHVYANLNSQKLFEKYVPPNIVHTKLNMFTVFSQH